MVLRRGRDNVPLVANNLPSFDSNNPIGSLGNFWIMGNNYDSCIEIMI